MTERNPVWSLYMHVNKINGKVYIGITSVKPQKRWLNGYGYKRNSHFFNAIKKYGWENFEHYVLMESEDEQLIKQCEIIGIQVANSTNPEYGYNISKGGDGYLKYVTQQQIEQHIKNKNERIRRNNKNWYQKNRQLSISQSKKYRQQHRQEISQYDSEYYVQHRQNILAYHDKYRDEHRYEINEKLRQYRINNLQKRKQKDKRYYQQHKEQIHQKRRQKRLMMKNNTIQGGAVSNEQH